MALLRSDLQFTVSGLTQLLQQKQGQGLVRLAFDIETNGLLDTLTKIHCLVIRNVDTGELLNCADHDGYQPVREGLKALADADVIIGHNVIRFDLPALHKLFPLWRPKGIVRDTLVMAELMFPSDDIKRDDSKRMLQGTMPGNMVGNHSLKAWGYRLGKHKGSIATDEGTDWSRWTPEMQAYCVQDVDVSVVLWKHLEKQAWAEQSVELEHGVATIIARQERFGFPFALKKAQQLHVKLMEAYEEEAAKLIPLFPPWLVPDAHSGDVGYRLPKVNRKSAGITAGVPYTKLKLLEFNPKSRDHIASRLKWKYGWIPDEKTEKGKPKVDEAVMAKLPYDEARHLQNLLLLAKRISQLATGQQAWLKHFNPATGRIHGRVKVNGAYTGRMTHSLPNMAQIPSLKVLWGAECRELFEAPPGWIIVGCDADSLELRNLAHFMARYDGGAYIETVLKGNKDLGTDMHSQNCRAIGLDPKQKYPVDGKMLSGRDIAKTWFYAFIYGSGDEKLGHIMGIRGQLKWLLPRWARGDETKGKWVDVKATKAGAKARENFVASLPALAALTKSGADKSRSQGFIYGLDKRRIACRKAHAVLNTILQSAGGVVMKQALVMLDEALQQDGMVPGVDYEFLVNVHDEWQIAVNLHGRAPSDLIAGLFHDLKSNAPEVKARAETRVSTLSGNHLAAFEIVKKVGTKAATAIHDAGAHFNFRCPLAGNYDVGRNWRETH